MATDSAKQLFTLFVSELSKEYDDLLADFLPVDATSTDVTRESGGEDALKRKLQDFKAAFFGQIASGFDRFLAGWMAESDHQRAQQVQTLPAPGRSSLKISELIQNDSATTTAPSAPGRERPPAVDTVPRTTPGSENDDESGGSTLSPSPTQYSTSPSEVDGGETETPTKVRHGLPGWGTRAAQGELGDVACRWEPAGPGGLEVLVLLPTEEQFRAKQGDGVDLPRLLRAAQARGAAEHGAFKIILPEPMRDSLPRRRLRSDIPEPGCRHEQACEPQQCSVYTPVPVGRGFYRLETKQDRRQLCRPPGQSYEPVEDLEDLLRKNENRPLEGVHYLTDNPALTEEQRTEAGLPARSPIAVLEEDRLARTRHRLHGVHGTTDFEGPPGAPFCWHIEPPHLFALNCCYAGEKVWNVIPPGHRAAAEAVFRKLPLLPGAANAKCAAFMKHDAIFGVSGFAESGIPLRSFRQSVAEIVVTFPDAYHSGHNVDYSVVDARNYADDKWAVVESECCRKTCPGGSITYKHLRSRGPGEKQFAEDEEEPEQVQRTMPVRKLLQPTTMPSRKRPAPVLQTARAAKSLKAMQKQDRMGAPITTAGVLGQQLLSILRSREAIQQFVSLVASRRAPDNSFRFRGGHDEVERLLGYLGGAVDSSTYAKFIERYGLFRLTAGLESKRHGAFRLDREELRKVRDSLGWTIDQLNHRLARGRLFYHAFPPKDGLDGLLCFPPLLKHDDFDPQYDLKLKEKELATFHAHLKKDKYIMAICGAGKALLNSLEAADVQFKWETLSSFDPTSLSEDDLLSYLQPLPPITENLYRPEEYPYWERPTGWPEDWAWPADPTSEGVSGCNLCEGTSCDCISQPSRFQPRIKQYGPKGFGLQAVGDTHGTIVYRKDDIIGFLFGKIVPAETALDDMALEFVRSDIPEEPIVCRLDCREYSNHFRLLNHDCSPSARLTANKVSGRWVMAVRANNHIYDGMEITVSYGRKHYKDKCLCETCRIKTTIPVGGI